MSTVVRTQASKKQLFLFRNHQALGGTQWPWRITLPCLLSSPHRRRPELAPAEIHGRSNGTVRSPATGGSAVSFNVLAIRSGEETGDGALHPILTDASQPELIALDAYDGPNVMRAVATAVSVMEVTGAGRKTLVRLREVKIDVYITDGRLALACEKYDKGGGWSGFGAGGAAIAITANAVSKARAARRSRGKVLVGHIRYPWLKAVGASSKSGFATTEAIRLEFSQKLSGTAVRKLIELTLPRNIDATLVAEEIARRAAAFRLAYYTDMKPEARAEFARLSQAPPRLQPEPKKFAFHQMPTFFYVSAQTAFPSAPRSGLPQPTLAAPEAPAYTPVPEVRTYDAGLGHVAVPAQPAVPTRPTGPARPVQSFCTQCGTRYVAGDNFCLQCGTSVNGRNGYTPERSAGY